MPNTVITRETERAQQHQQVKNTKKMMICATSKSSLRRPASHWQWMSSIDCNNRHHRRPSNNNNYMASSTRVASFLALLLLALSVQVIPSLTLFVGDSSGRQQQPQQFDPTSYRNIYEAIRGHPDLREFATLCEADGVKEIVSMDRTPLTVFAPIDKSLGDLLTKSKSRTTINLIELAKHHIAQGFVAPDENTKYPLQFSSYSLLSPLYLNQLSHSQPARGSNQAQAQAPCAFVNNAKILATHLIPIDSDNYQTLHVIDQPLEFAYANRKAQLRTLTGQSGAGGSGSSSGAQVAQYKKTTVKRSLSLDDLSSPTTGEQQAAYEFYERFADIQANQPDVDLYHARVFKGSQQLQRISLARDEFNLERLARTLRQHPQLKGRLYQVNESSSLNTYFLPLNSDELDALLDGPASADPLTFEAHVIPDQVLFTRTMALGTGHATLFDRDSSTHRVSLSLAKTLPDSMLAADGVQSSDPLDSSSIGSSDYSSDSSSASSKFLATPLLVQSKCSAVSGAGAPAESANMARYRAGVTSAEVLVANIPLSNGVLHLIKKPLLVTETNVLDYLNDNDNQLSNVVGALGSRTAAAASPQGGRRTQQQQGPAAAAIEAPIRVNRFRELLARERQMLSTFSTDPTMNKTILAPSDEAFQRLRYDLRALVQGDESLIPQHWDSSYRHDLLERLVKRHVVLHQTLTTDQMEAAGPNGASLQSLSDNGKLLSFSSSAPGEFQVDCDSTQARLVHHDLIGTNGVLHIIDRVLGEEQETVHSLLKSLVLKFNHSLEASGNSNPNGEMGQLIQANLRNGGQQQDMISPSPNSINLGGGEHQSSVDSARGAQQQAPELSAISKSIGQFLDELSSSQRRHQLQLLASSVNISFQLARLTSLAEGLDDWNERFKQTDRQFTYFVPSDLAWIRLQQAQPELHKPLMYFLEQLGDERQQAGEMIGSTGSQDSSSSNSIEAGSGGVGPAGAGKPLRSSESSHRLRQILERHLVVNRRLAKKDLGQLDSLQTLGATLRLVPQQPQPLPPHQHQLLTGTTFEGADLQPTALHSIASAGSNQQQSANTVTGQPQSADLAGKFKALKLNSASANIVQVNEASNGFVYIIDNVLLLPEDSDYIVQTSAAPAVSSSMSSLLGAHNSAILDFIHGLLAPAPLNMSAHSILALIGVVTVAISVLLVLALVLLVRRRRQNKLSRHQQLESGLTSSSSANSGSTSTTKSL